MKAWINRNKGLFIIVTVAFLGVLLVLLGNGEESEGRNIEITDEEIEEQRIKEMVETIEGVKEVSVLVNFNEKTQAGAFSDGYEYKNIKGIAISAKGCDNILIVEKIKSLICAAYDISGEMIYVCDK